MKRQMSRKKVLVLMALIFALVASYVIGPVSVAEAATKKTALSETEMTIPVGKVTNKASWVLDTYGIGTGRKLTVENPVKGATYQFTSSNTKVVKISKDGGYLTGVKAGTATITCTQTLKNKKTTIGKCKVTVKKASLSANKYDNVFAIGKGEGTVADYFVGFEPLYTIAFRNPDATYTLTSNSDNFTIKEVKYDAKKIEKTVTDDVYQDMLKDYIGKGYYIGYEFNAKAAGTYKITVNETYNKKTTKLGTFTVEVKETTLTNTKHEVLLGTYLGSYDFIEYAKADKDYYFNVKDYDAANPDNNVLKIEKEYGKYSFYANKAGSVEVTVTEGSSDGTVIGTFTVTVIEIPVEKIILDPEYTAYVGDEYFSIYYDVEPYDTTDKLSKVESDNSEVLKVEYDSQYNYWIITPLKAGVANITLTVGDKTAVTKVTVKENEYDYDYDDEY